MILFYVYDMIHLTAAIRLTHGGSSTVHINTQTIHGTTQNLGRVPACAPSLRAIPWQLPYN